VRDNGAVRSPADDSATQNRAQLVIFDLDGTLTDSAAGVVASFRHALAAIGAEPPPGDLAARVVGPPLAQTMVTLGLGDRAEEAVAAYRADYTSRGWAMNALYDGIADLLEDLRAAGTRLAVATSKSEPAARRILDHFGIGGHFEVIAGADGDRTAKADVLAHALSQLGPLPQTVLMVGDRIHDVEGAALHGIDTIVVEWGYGASDFAEETDPAPAASVATVAELREVLGV
jgi:phosphoglycolate phosphatase-like HAD superfamily hydrolase